MVQTASGSLVVFGGSVGGSYKNDVWASTNLGVNWTQIKGNNTSGWSARMIAAAFLVSGTFYICGGLFSTTHYYDTWSSPDAINWTNITNSVGILGGGT
jgi:hypothetical protein